MAKLIVDIYGGDNGPEVVVKGALKALDEIKNLELVFAGEKALVEKLAKANGSELSRISYLDTTSFITNHDNPKLIFKGYDDSSLVKALEECKNNPEVDGMFSCGATGAVMIGSIFRLGLLEKMSFPCLTASLFSFSGKPLILVDCGASVDCKPENILTFAKVGVATCKAYHGIKSPRVGLINVGKEEGKGNALMKESYNLLKENVENFVGNIEGSNVFADDCDVIVCDGFSGNVILKLAESVGLACASISKDKEVKDRLYNTFAYNDLGASMVMGAKKVVVKAHGAANELTVYSSIKQALKLVNGNVIKKLEELL